jgi:hypothetical protein
MFLRTLATIFNTSELGPPGEVGTDEDDAGDTGGSSAFMVVSFSGLSILEKALFLFEDVKE